MHFHRDMLATCDSYGRHVLRAAADDRFIGSPPLAFTFGLGGLVLFPLRVGAVDDPAGEARRRTTCSPAIAKFSATVCFTAPTAYRAMLAQARRARHLVAAQMRVRRRDPAEGHVRRLARGDRHQDPRRHRRDRDAAHLHRLAARTRSAPAPPAGRCRATRRAWSTTTATRCRPARIGRLAVRGPTGCRYLADTRQRNYVQNGWNITGDTYLMDADGYFWYQARSDDMIVSAGYNIAGPEVEAALLDASGGRRMRRGRRARRGARADRQGLCRAAPRPYRRRGADQDCCRTTSRRRSRPTNIRAPSNTSPHCRAPRPASCSASSCAAWRANAASHQLAS